MGLLSFLSGSKKAMDTAGNIVDGAISGIDKLWFTPEEKSDASKKVLEIVLERVKLAVGESSVRSMTRRIIAIMFSGTFLTLLLASAIIYKFDSAWALHLYKTACTLTNAVIAIIIFYFGSYGIGYLMDRKKK